MAEDKTEEEQPAPAGVSIKVVIIAIVTSVLLMAALAGGAMYALGVFDDKTATESTAEAEPVEETAEPPEPPKYHSMDPKFVISFSEQRNARFMQFSLQLMTRDNAVVKLLKEHSPAIRSSMLLLFGSRTYEEMITREGKQKMLDDVVINVNETLTELIGADELGDGVEKAYFDSFVIQ